MAAERELYPAEFKMRNQPPLDRLSTTTRCKGFHVVVTGGASGIGRATVERFLNDGAERVAIFDIDEKLSQYTLEDIQKDGVAKERIRAYKVDISDEAQVISAVTDFAESVCGGRIDAFVHCAARFTSMSKGATDKHYLDAYSVNVIGGIQCVQALHKYMKGGADSAIVFLSSTAAHVAQKQRYTYAATKGATNILIKNMAFDLGVDGIRANAIVPGYVWSPVEKAVSPDGSREAMSFLTHPASISNRDSQVAEMGAIIVFLCCADASAITGTIIRCDCGYLAMGPDSKSEEWSKLYSLQN